MFDHLPIIKTSKATYYQFTSILGFTVIILILMIVTLINIILRCVLRRAKAKYQELEEIGSINNEIPLRKIGEPSNSDGEEEFQMSRPEMNKLRKWKDPKIQFRLKLAIIAMESFTIVLMMNIFDAFVAFDFFPASFSTAFLKLAIFFPIWCYGIYRFFTFMNFTNEFVMSLRKWSIPMAFGLFVYSYASVTFAAGFCMCIHNNTTPGMNLNKFHFSTAWWRNTMDSTCPSEEKPCMVYPTLPENGLNEVFMNFHINPSSCLNEICTPVLEYQAVGAGNTWGTIIPEKSEYDHPDSEYTRRDIYTALITELEPNTTYIFRLKNKAWSTEDFPLYSYKTLDLDNFSILLGGDIGNKQEALNMNKNVVEKLSFDAIMIGGDYAYDNGVPTCYRAVDYFLKRLPYDRYDKETNSTRVVPIMIALGNHDGGVNSYVGATIPHTKSEPVYKHYFPQNTDNGKIPSVTERRSFYSHKFGDKMHLMFLDAAYYSTIEGEQTRWLEKELEDSNTQIKIAQYHGPIVTAVRHTSEPDYKVIKHGKENWIPLFDKYKMTIVSENHSHVFKRSKVLQNFEEREEGVVYIGEGSWGIHVNDNPPHVDPQWFEKFKITQHVWHLKMEDGVINAIAYNEKMEILDETVIKY